MTEYTFKTFKNDSNLKFVDISSEAWREYRRPDAVIRIDQPIALHVSKSGGHRVFDAEGVSHYIPSGWIHLRWMVNENEPHFVV